MMATFSAALRTCPGSAITEAAERFIGGRVEGQSLTFAPSIAEFSTEVRRCQDMIRWRMRALPAPSVPAVAASRRAPFEVLAAKTRSRFAERPILFQEVTLDQFKVLSRHRQIPPGSTFSVLLGTVYGPEDAGDWQPPPAEIVEAELMQPIHDYSAEPVETTETLKRQLAQRAKEEERFQRDYPDMEQG